MLLLYRRIMYPHMAAERANANAMMATGPATGQRVKTAQFPGPLDDDADDDRERMGRLHYFDLLFAVPFGLSSDFA